MVRRENLAAAASPSGGVDTSSALGDRALGLGRLFARRPGAVALVLAGLLVGLPAGCKRGDQRGKGRTVEVTAATAAQMEQLQKEESDFLAKREELSAARKQITAARQALFEKRKQAIAAGGDLQAVEKEEQELATREGRLAEQETDLEKSYEDLVVKYQAAAASGGTGEEVTRREASVAVREKDFARREESLSRREAELAARERELAKREKETCGGGTVTTIVQAAPAPKGSRYTKSDVEPTLKKAHKIMSSKGVLRTDLPSPTTAMEKDATSAMAEGDYARAKFAADQFLALVDGMAVDRAFIAAKIGRLNAAMKASPVADDKRKEVEELFRGATSDYGDGKFAAANGKLNKIYALIR